MNKTEKWQLDQIVRIFNQDKVIESFKQNTDGLCICVKGSFNLDISYSNTLDTELKKLTDSINLTRKKRK